MEKISRAKKKRIETMIKCFSASRKLLAKFQKKSHWFYYAPKEILEKLEERN